MIVYFCDRAMQILGHASTELSAGLRISEDHKIEDIETGTTSLELIMPCHENRASAYEKVRAGNYLLVTDYNPSEDDRAVRTGCYTIITTECSLTSIRVYAEDEGLDLLNTVHLAYENKTAKTAAEYINMFLNESGFELGRNGVATLKKVLSWQISETTASRLQDIASAFGAELSYRFDIKGSDILHKYVDIEKERGTQLLHPFYVNKQVSELTMSQSVENLATALYVQGGIPGSSKGIKSYVGTDGKQRYTWLKFAANAESGMSNSFVGKDYIGLAYDRTNEEESTTYADYKWSKIKSGNSYEYSGFSDGKGTYTWVLFSKSSDGTSPTKNPGGCIYIGFAYGKTTDAMTMTPSDYKWSRLASEASEAITLKGYKYDDGDIYIDGETLKSRTALQNWSRYLTLTENVNGRGHIVRLYMSDTVDQKELLEEAIEELKTVREPVITYEVDILDNTADIHIGDTLTIEDDDGGIHMTARVMKLDSSVALRKKTVTLGDYTILQSKISQQLRELAESITSHENSYDEAIGGALSAAATAQQTADAAQETSTSAMTAAASAQSVAASAQATAVDAQATAINAQTTAINAQSTASAAQTTADGKNSVYYQDEPPSGTDHAKGDLWFDTDGDNACYTWTGSEWELKAFGNQAIANLDAGKITAGTIDAERINTASLFTEEVTLPSTGAVKVQTDSGDMILNSSGLSAQGTDNTAAQAYISPYVEGGVSIYAADDSYQQALHVMPDGVSIIGHLIINSAWSVGKEWKDSGQLEAYNANFSYAYIGALTAGYVKVSDDDYEISLSDIIYEKGSWSGYARVHGFVTTSGTLLDIIVDTKKIIPPDATIKVTALTAAIRHVGGNYIVSNGANLISYLTTTTRQGIDHIRLQLTKSSGWGVTNNTPVDGTVTITFTLS